MTEAEVQEMHERYEQAAAAAADWMDIAGRLRTKVDHLMTRNRQQRAEIERLREERDQAYMNGHNDGWVERDEDG